MLDLRLYSFVFITAILLCCSKSNAQEAEIGLWGGVTNSFGDMGTWKPALLHGKPVAKKMIQTITVEKP